MNSLELLSLTFECESSLGKSLDLNTMSKEFLKVFLKRTSALYAALLRCNEDEVEVIEDRGKDNFYKMIHGYSLKKRDKYEIIKIEDKGHIYYYLSIPLDDYMLAFIYSEKIHFDINVIANIFYSLRHKIQLGIEACLEHEHIQILNQELLKKKNMFESQAKRFQSLLDQTPSIAVQGYTSEGTLIYWNDASEKFYGYTRQEAIGSKCGDILIPKSVKETLKAAVKEWVEHGTRMLPQEFTLIDKKGKDVYVYSQPVLIETKDGGHEIYCLQMNLEHIKKTESKLKKSEAKLLAAQQIAKLGNWEWDTKNKHMIWSNEVFRIYGEKPQAFVPTYDIFLTYIEPNDRLRVMKAVARAKKTKKVQRIEHKVIRKDGTIRYILASGKAIYDRNGHFSTMIGTVQDITDQKQVENMLQQKAQIIEQIHDSVIIMDLEGNILNWNNTAVFNLGYLAEEMVGKHISTLYSEEQKQSMLKVFAKLKKYGVLRTEIEIMHKNGNIFYGNLLLSYLKDDRGEKTSIIAYIENINRRKKTENELRRQKNLMEYRAYHDELTGLPNRAFFLEELNYAIKRVRHGESMGALLFIDLDHFKEINDSLGHKHGDNVLQIVGQRLAEALREDSFLARFGGDEFTAILENVSGMKCVIEKVQKLMQALNVPITIDDHTHYITFSIGISLFPEDGVTAETLLKNSDASMYKAKEEGRNTYVFYEQQMTHQAFERVLLATDLRQALKANAFEIYYQPQINAITGNIIGMEGLIRWKHETKGMIFPSKFILIAEDNGMIIEIDRWMMKTGMEQVCKWRREGLNPGILTLNLSIKQLQTKDFIDVLKKMIKESQCEPEWLELEITESQIMNNPEYSIEVLQQVSDLGIRLAVDDFGTGYSSLSYLKRLPIDKLKIDQSFIKDIPYDQEDKSIVESIITLSKSLKLDVIAEGVEREDQRDFLVEHDCVNIQGYLYSKPINTIEMEKMLRKRKALMKKSTSSNVLYYI